MIGAPPKPLAAVALAACLPLAGAAERLAAPETTARGYRIRVERLSQFQNLALDFAEAGAPEEGGISGVQRIYLGLAVFPPRPELVDRIEGLDPRVLALPQAGGGRPILFQPSAPEESGPAGPGAWRTSLVAQDVSLSSTRIGRLKGELIVYPQARRVTLEFPAEAAHPVTRSGDGFRVTLKPARVTATLLSLNVEMEWPADRSVSRVNPEAPDGVVGLTRAGNLLLPYRGSSVTTSRAGFRGRQSLLTFSDGRELPEKVRVEVIVRSGTAERIPFVLPELPLPDSMDLRAELAGEKVEAGPLAARHPLYSRGGGILRQRVVVPPGQPPGNVLFGLSPVTPGSSGAWRWIEVAVDLSGSAALPDLRAGTYRVTRRWLPVSDDSALRRLPEGTILQVAVAPGRSVELPVLTPEAGP